MVIRGQRSFCSRRSEVSPAIAEKTEFCFYISTQGQTCPTCQSSNVIVLIDLRAVSEYQLGCLSSPGRLPDPHQEPTLQWAQFWEAVTYAERMHRTQLLCSGKRNCLVSDSDTSLWRELHASASQVSDYLGNCLFS